MEANTSAVSGEAQLMDELKKLEQSARQYQQEVSFTANHQHEWFFSPVSPSLLCCHWKDWSWWFELCE